MWSNLLFSLSDLAFCQQRNTWIYLWFFFDRVAALWTPNKNSCDIWMFAFEKLKSSSKKNIASVLPVTICWNLLVTKTSRPLVLLLLSECFHICCFSSLLFSIPVLCFGTYSCGWMVLTVRVYWISIFLDRETLWWHLLHVYKTHCSASHLLTFFLNGREVGEAATRGLATRWLSWNV